MVAPRLQFHQSMFPILGIQMKGAVYQNQCRRNAKANTNPLMDACHIHDYEHDKQTQQPACEDEKVLTFQPIKLRRFSNPFIYTVFNHNLEEERTQNGCCYNQKDTGAEPRGGSFAGVGIAARKLAVNLYASD